MNDIVNDPSVLIAGLKAALPSETGDAIVLKAQALIAGEMHQLDVAIQTDLAPAVAIALLRSTAVARSGTATMDPAMLCIAAGVVPAHELGNVRIQLLFERGAVLPVEIPLLEAARLKRDLEQALESKT